MLKFHPDSGDLVHRLDALCSMEDMKMLIDRRSEESAVWGIGETSTPRDIGQIPAIRYLKN